VLRVLLTSVPLLLWWRWSDLSVAGLGHALGSVPLWAALLSALISEAGLFVFAVRWRVLLVAFGAPQPPSAGSLYRRTLVGHFFGLFLPLSLGTDAIHGLLTREVMPGRADPWIVALLGRAYGLVALLVLCALCLVVAPAGFPVVTAAVSAAALAAVLVLVAWQVGGRHAVRWLPARLRQMAVFQPEAHRLGVVAACLGLSVLTMTCAALAQYAVLVPLAPGLSSPAMLGAILLSLLAASLPSLFGFGPGQVALAALLVPLGVPAAVAMGAAVARWAIALVEALGGGMLNMLGRSR